MFGGLGGDGAHTLANLQCLSQVSSLGGQCFLVDQNQVYTAIKNDKIVFGSNLSQRVSIFAIYGEACGVFERNLDYTLENYMLSSNNPIGEGNHFVNGKNAEIEVKDGELLIVYDI